MERAQEARDRFSRRRGLGVWATMWAVVLSALFIGVTALTVGLWLTDPEYGETTPVGDLAFLTLGAMIAVGFAAQIRNPGHGVAGVRQALAVSLALGCAGLLGRRIEPLVGSMLFLAAGVVLWALHPARSHLLGTGSRVSVPLAGLAVVAGVPGAGYAARLLSLARRAGPSCFLGQCARGDRFAEMAAASMAVVAVALVASWAVEESRLCVRSSGISAAVVGSVSLALPDAPGSMGRLWGAFAVAWGVVFVVTGEWEARRPAPRPDVRAGRTVGTPP